MELYSDLVLAVICFKFKSILGAEDIKTHMDEFKEELSLGQRLTDTDILELHILIEQASHEIRHLRPAVNWKRAYDIYLLV